MIHLKVCRKFISPCENIFSGIFIEIQNFVDKGFLQWKANFEKKTGTFFYCSKKKKGSARTYYKCNRSGFYSSVSKGLRHLKVQGTRKINSWCPASILVTSTDGKVYVKFYKNHVGHETELKHISLPRSDRETIAGFISLGLRKNSILQRIRASWTDENMERIHLTSAKDLENIAKSFNLSCDVKRDKNDLISVESLVEEMKNSDYDPILLWKDPDESNDNFMLAISTKGQRYLLELHSDNIIAIDSTHVTNDYDFQLTTIMIVDENR